MVFKALQNRWIRATELADAARRTGKRGSTPEIGAGEFLKGVLGQKIDKADAEDPKFVENLKEEIKKDVKPENQAVFEKDLQVDKDRIQADKDSQRQEWLDKTANSPAAKAGHSDERRWELHLKNQAWRKERGRKYSHGDFLGTEGTPVPMTKKNGKGKEPTSKKVEEFLNPTDIKIGQVYVEDTVPNV